MKKVLIAVPSKDFDPTECAIPWKILTQAGIAMSFATPDGVVAQCDPRMLSGEGLGALSSFLRGDKNARDAYQELLLSKEFKAPLKWSVIHASDFDGLILPGGHAPGMKEYLESLHLQNTVREFFAADKPVGAICHGVVLVARSRNAEGTSVLYGRKTTALLATQECSAWALTCLWLGRYYRTYEQTVEAEVISNLASPNDFIKGPPPLFRDEPSKLERGFTVLDGNYLSARWPGDAHRFAKDFLKLLTSK